MTEDDRPLSMIERLMAEQNRMLSTRFDSMEANLTQRVARVENKVDDLNSVHATLADHAARIAGHDRELGEIKRTHDGDLAEIKGQLDKRSDRLPLWAAVVVALIGLGVSVVALFLH